MLLLLRQKGQSQIQRLERLRLPLLLLHYSLKLGTRIGVAIEINFTVFEMVI